jgi:ribosomal protein S18 acetylase RimI-like enzyme
MIRIRHAEVKDAILLVDLNHKVFVNNINFDEDLKQDPAPVSYIEQIINKPDGCFLVLEEDEQMIGYTSGSPIHFGYRKSKYFEIENLGVLPEKKRQGYGKILLDAISKWAKDHGYEKLYLNCYIKNHEAIDFYERNGYTPIDICLEKKI